VDRNSIINPEGARATDPVERPQGAYIRGIYGKYLLLLPRPLGAGHYTSCLYGQPIRALGALTLGGTCVVAKKGWGKMTVLPRPLGTIRYTSYLYVNSCFDPRYMYLGHTL